MEMASAQQADPDEARHNPSRTKAWILGLALVLLTLAVFWPAATYDFIFVDDFENIVANTRIQAGLTWGNLVWSFQTFHSRSWQPMTWLSHLIDCGLYGLSPGGHHFTSLLLHVINTLLVFVVVKKMTGALWRSLIVSFLFAFHPLHVEPAAWVSARAEVLGTLFSLLTVWVYTAYADVQQRSLLRKAGYLSALLFFALGLMSNPMLVTMPLVLLLLDFWPLHRVTRDAWGARGLSALKGTLAEKIPFFVLSIAFSVVTFVAQRAGANADVQPISLLGRTINSLTSYAQYLGKAIWPLNLGFPYPLREQIPWWEVAGALLVLAGITWLAISVVRSWPHILAGWFWFLVMLLPVIGMEQVGLQALPDRYSYFPLVGVFVAVVWTVYEVGRRWRFSKIIFAGTVGAVGLVSVVASSLQLRYWRDGEALFTHTTQVTDNNFAALNFLGLALASKGQHERAAESYLAAIEANPQCADCYNNLGLSLARLGYVEDAKAAYESALKVKPNFPLAKQNLDRLLARGDLAEAEQQLRSTVNEQPSPEHHLKLGATLKAQGKYGEAASEFVEALRLRPADLQARLNLGLALALGGNTEAAAEHFAAVIKEQPDNAEAHFYYALCLVSRGQTAAAVPYYREVIRLKPDWADALNDLAWILATHPDASVRNGKEAVQLAEKACRLSDWKQAPYLGTLDAAYAEVGDFKKAFEMAGKTFDLARSTGQHQVATLAQERAALYRAGRPFRQRSSN